MNNHPDEREDRNAPVPLTFWILVIVAIGCLAMAFFSTGCKSSTAQAPQASTAAVGVNLDELGESLGKARTNVDGVRSDLSEVDAKAVRIKEAINHW